MTKRSSRPAASQMETAERGKVQSLFGGGWDPLNEKRDQSYVRKVQPRSPNQQRFLTAIADHSLSFPWRCIDVSSAQRIDKRIHR